MGDNCGDRTPATSPAAPAVLWVRFVTAVRPVLGVLALPAVLAAALTIAGCAASSGSGTGPSTSPLFPLTTPSPANPALSGHLLSPTKLPPGWAYLLFAGPDPLPPRPCDTGAIAAAKVGLTSGPHVVVEDGTLFDSVTDASAFIRREATGHSCATPASASQPPRTPLVAPHVGDESYSFRSTGRGCQDLILFRRAVVVLELVTPCSETPGAVSAYVEAAAKTS